MLNLLWTSVTDDTLRAISSNLPHLTALYLPTAGRPGWRDHTVQGIRECRAALLHLRSLYVKPHHGYERRPRNGDELEHDCWWNTKLIEGEKKKEGKTYAYVNL